tara:strand:- start:54 stop:203 length:150 start_codon:yes stop_codon:yes gene_type:complete
MWVGWTKNCIDLLTPATITAGAAKRGEQAAVIGMELPNRTSHGLTYLKK